MATKEKKAAAAAAKKAQKEAAAAAKKELAELKKTAKSLKIDFDSSTTLEELRVLVETEQAARKAQAEQAGELPPAPTGTEEAPVSQAPVVETTPEGETILSSHNKSGIMAVEKDGEFFLRNKAGQVLGSFEDKASIMRHMENLSRF